jgi:hypothetical protein
MGVLDYGAPMSAGQPVGGGDAPGGGGFNWKAMLPALLGGAGSALLGGKAGLAGFATGFANESHRRMREQEEKNFRMESALADQAHKEWQELANLDLSNVPPEMAGVKERLDQLSQKRIQSLSADSPGGARQTAKESQELIALAATLRGSVPQINRANEEQQFLRQADLKQQVADKPLVQGYENQMLSDAGVDRSELGSMSLPPEELQRLAASRLSTDRVAQQQYETPVWDEALGAMVSPQQKVTLRGQDLQTQRQLQMEMMRADREAGREDRRDERQLRALAATQNRFNDYPVPVQTKDADGNPVTIYVPRSEATGQSFARPLPAAERLKAKEADAALSQIEQLGNLYDDKFVGPISARAYSAKTMVPEGLLNAVGAPLDPLRSEFKAQSAAIKNQMIKLITGAQMSNEEAGRILASVPDDTLNPTEWKARYASTRHNAQILHQIMAGGLSKDEGLSKLNITNPPLRMSAPPVAGTAPASGGNNRVQEYLRKKGIRQ